MSDPVYHIPALLPQTLQALDIKPDGVYIDATYGGGGHSRAIMQQLDAQQGGHLYSFDQDEDAIARAIDDPRFTIVHGNFRFLTNFMRYYRVEAVDGILADLGVSFHHFDDPGRGFSFRWDGQLDMRMNRRAPRSAAWYLANLDTDALTDIFKIYGEFRQARRLAEAIVKARANAPVDTVGQLLDIARPMINPRQEKKELAQLFQALRIQVNDETGALRKFLEQSCSILCPGGHLCVITYHSIEDRMVKNFMKTGNIEGRLEKDFYGRALAPMKLLTTRPIIADEAEVTANPRSRSAKLRVAVKL